MPINERSHIKIASEPFDDPLSISYQLYGRETKQAPMYGVVRNKENWDWKIDLKHLGTLYSSKEQSSPAGEKLERYWDDIWDEGDLDMEGIRQLTSKAFEVPEAKQENNSKSDRTGKTDDLYDPQLELPLSMFSIRPSW